MSTLMQSTGVRSCSISGSSDFSDNLLRTPGIILSFNAETWGLLTSGVKLRRIRTCDHRHPCATWFSTCCHSFSTGITFVSASGKLIIPKDLKSRITAHLAGIPFGDLPTQIQQLPQLSLGYRKIPKSFTLHGIQGRLGSGMLVCKLAD